MSAKPLPQRLRDGWSIEVRREAADIIERLAAELAAAKRDAARYRWLRDKADKPAICDVVGSDWVPIHPGRLDAVVDAAMQIEKEQS